MKSVIAAILLSSLIAANRLLQSATTSAPCATITYNNPYTGQSICCPADDTCGYPQDYTDQPIAICSDGNEYPSKCHGYCSGQKPESCGLICECQTDTDCAPGYKCRETPFGLAGCDKNVGNSCFGFCVAVGDECAKDDDSKCQSNEQCFLEQYGNGKGYCGSLQSDCACKEGEVLNNEGKCAIPSCGGIPYCQSYKPDSCNTCGCSDPSSDLAKCTLQFCGPSDPANYKCTKCIDGYSFNANGECKKDSIEGPKCGNIGDLPCKNGYECINGVCVRKPNSCATTRCSIGAEVCYETSTGPICCDPKICIQGPKCGNIGDSPCKPGYECINGVCIRLSCYETEAGLKCCDPNICQGGFCGGIGNIECPKGYECVNDPANPCDPTTTSDCGGICVDPDASKSDECLFENCALYNDGCNDCRCDAQGTSVSCTEKTCHPTTIKKPYCNKCNDGYTLNDNNQCILQPITCPDNCAAYNDGCNDCICGENGLDACTKKLCPPPPEGVTIEPKCTKCKPGYKVNNGKCDGCVCIALFDPVCCGGKTYSNSCVAGCQQATGPCFPGACPTGCQALKCPTGSSCCNDGGGAAICCSDPVPVTTKSEPTCCDPADQPGFNGNEFCLEGHACCPDGTWSCSIGDGKTFSCGDDGNLVKGKDIFGKVCCNRNKDCLEEFKCRKDPECRGGQNGSAAGCDKVCIDIDGMCQVDIECDAGYKCVKLNNGNGVCVKYQ